MLDDYARSGGAHDFDSRGNGPPMKRPRLDALHDGHWANAPADRRGGGGGGFPSIPPQGSHWRENNHDSHLFSNPNSMAEESLDDTLSAARHGVSPFFQTATDDEIR